MAMEGGGWSEQESKTEDSSSWGSFVLSFNRQVIDSVIRVLQKNQGFLSLHDVHQHLLKNDMTACEVFHFSSEGLLALLSEAILRGGPTYFNACIINNMLYSVSVLGKKKMKTIVSELSTSNPRTVMHPSNFQALTGASKPEAVSSVLTAQLLISCMNVLEENKNGMGVDELYRLVRSEREEEMKGTVLENSLVNFRQFVADHPVELCLASDGARVFSLVDVNSNDVDKAVLGVRMAVLLKGGSLNVKSLVGHLSTVASVRAVTGGSVESLRNFVSQHPEAFLIDSNGDVSVTGGRASPNEASSKLKVENQRASIGDVSVTGGGRGSPLEASSKKKVENQPINSTKKQPKVKKTWVNSKVMTKSVPLEARNGDGSSRYCRSVVISVFLKFGFIHHGAKEDENIYFDSAHFVHSSHSAPIDEVGDLKAYLKVGDQVDCLFREVKHTKSKFQACAVWKVADGARSNELCLQPIYELPFKVLVGSATVSFLSGGVVGCCEPANQEREDSLIDFDGKNKYKVKMIGFHLGWLMSSKSLSGKLSVGSRISLLAKPVVKVSGRLSSHWIAISAWINKTSSGGSSSSLNQRVVRAEVRALTSDGGLMSFGEDVWAHRATFHWETIAETISTRPAPGREPRGSEFLVLSVGDPLWCVVSESTESPLGSTKWTVNQLVPYHANDNGCPPLSLRKYQPFESSSNSISLLDITDIDIPSSPLAAKSAAMEPLLDINLIDLSNLSVSCSSQSNEGVVVVEEAGGIIVSRDVYGGMIEGDDKSVVCFGAHAFYLDGRAICHLAFKERTAVHYRARAKPNTHTLVADKVWIGKKPL